MPSIVHIDFPCDDVERSKEFYSKLFDWEITATPGMPDYYFVKTKNLDGSEGIAGGMGKRGEPSQRITNYVGVTDIDEYMKKVEALGGKILQDKMPVPGWGYLATCMDTENNVFGLWQEEKSAE